MKILAVGDLHGDLRQATRIAEKAKKEKADLIIINGDFTLGDRHTQGLFAVLKNTKIPILALPGNHESMATFESLAKKYDFMSIHGYAAKFGDVGIFGCGAADVGLFQLSEKEIYSLLKKSFNYVKDCKKKIMVTHMHPDGVKFSKIFAGSKAIKNAIKTFKPDLALCSHIHEASGLEDVIGQTKLLVVGKEGHVINI
ncbi:MAG: metallophosphoesterase family protein [Candidatus Nanoarchaeia archaeon]